METIYSPFKGTDEMRQHATSLDTAVAVPIYYKDSYGNDVQVPGSKGVMNESKGYYVATVSDGYALLQNTEMVTRVADALDQLDISPVGKIVNSSHKVSLEIHFPQFEISERDHNLPVYLGSRIVNSYNKTTGFRGHGFMHRLWCKNGAYAAQALPELVFSEVHKGDLEVRAVDILKNYVENLENARDVIARVLNVASEYEVMFKEQDQIIASLGKWAGSRRAGKEIFNHLNKEVPVDELKVSRYDLWNAFTSFASHQDNLSPNVRDRISKVAENLLYPEKVFVVEENFKEYLDTSRKKVITVEPVIVG